MLAGHAMTHQDDLTAVIKCDPETALRTLPIDPVRLDRNAVLRTGCLSVAAPSA